ncbi:MAG: alpha/beta hydrolase [Flavobacteriaceae bacterium TMED238]|nr:alpha/beta hydrolase [Flavobacteriaceae bacterium]RPG61170.1 MAG: alpha/beta hydrolase [Flavobacteriaceae bacterium TMED238]RZP07460.1 MAG: alpha/beta hydrolase [Flavobacteriales bacterium]|tara:strand:- start:66 stop:1184 length:1119 start_codon:yes stop_codon:yes gene_type:complete
MKKVILLSLILITSCVNSNSKNTNLPGRLGDSEMSLKNDPRAIPAVIKVMSEFDMDGLAPEPPISIDATQQEKVDYLSSLEPVYEEVFKSWYSDLTEVEGLERFTKIIDGIDGNQIKLYIHKPKNHNSNTPGILHIHGGGMSILKASGPNYIRWRDDLASTGLVVVGVEFRNVAGELGSHPFPAGLNDCTSALQWMFDNKEKLGVSKIIISGESGGGNLTLATTLKAKKDEKLFQIDGVYAQCPYISNEYHRSINNLPSLVENNGYFLNVNDMAVMATAYDGVDSKNPLAWPLFATNKDLTGLPPHVISVNELDPLRDEGLLYYKKLLISGVDASSITINGTVHAGDMIFINATPKIYRSSLMHINNFANSL